ncbi:cytochrome P450 [Colletotrichum tofieldiae]|nr:cytochrome P450 [Colletotrichum tofieldiae]GKT74231.1 cytochrome P450 [Colletotrichum tofieldiae]
MGLFDSRLKFPIHMLQLALALAAIGVTVVRMFLPNAPRGRSGTMALGMGAKSLVIILYQVLTEHVSALKRWASLKANLILNALEIVFWAAVAYMSIQSNTQQCVGTTCTLGWVVVVIGILLSIVAGYATIISWLDFRYFKANGVARGSIRQHQLPLHSRCNSAQSQSVETIERDTRN